jgi:hypothetical protein
MKPMKTRASIIATDGDLPPDLAAAITRAEGTLETHDRLRSILEQTHTSIPKSLSDERQLTSALGSAEVAGGDTTGLRQQLADLNAQRETDVRRRASAADAALDDEPELISARQSVSQSAERFSLGIIADFGQRCSDAVAVLQRLQAEAAALTCALRLQVDAPVLPSAASGVAAPIPPAAQRIGELLDRLDGAINLCGGIRQSHNRNLIDGRLSENRTGATGQTVGTFLVAKAFVSMLDGLQFEAGTLIDSSLVGSANLRRLVTSRFVRPADTGNLKDTRWQTYQTSHDYTPAL